MHFTGFIVLTFTEANYFQIFCCQKRFPEPPHLYTPLLFDLKLLIELLFTMDAGNWFQSLIFLRKSNSICKVILNDA